MPIRLSRELLDALTNRLAQFQPWETAKLGPDLSAPELERAIAATGLHLSAEARLWWSWRGARTEPNAPWIGALRALSPQQAVREYAMSRDIYAEGADSEDEQWPPELLPFMRSAGGNLLCFTCVPRENSTITRWSDRDSIRPPLTAPSLGEVVTWWIESFDAGVMAFDPQSHRLTDFHFDRVPPERLPFL